MFFHVTENRATAGRIIGDVLSPALGRPEDLRRSLLIGPAQECAEKVAAYRAAGFRGSTCGPWVTKRVN